MSSSSLFHDLFQNYLRIQPDNVRTVNLITEITGFINVLYTHLNGNTIDTLSQVFNTLNEVCQVSFYANTMFYIHFQKKIHCKTPYNCPLELHYRICFNLISPNWPTNLSLPATALHIFIHVCFQGNQENRSVILNNKIIDYINFILRMSRFDGCTPQQVTCVSLLGLF